MPDIRPEDARSVAERVRKAIEQHDFIAGDGKLRLKVTVSIGLAFRLPGEPGVGLIRRADEALYASKNRGRNKVTLAAA